MSLLTEQCVANLNLGLPFWAIHAVCNTKGLPFEAAAGRDVVHYYAYFETPGCERVIKPVRTRRGVKAESMQSKAGQHWHEVISKLVNFTSYRDAATQLFDARFNGSAENPEFTVEILVTSVQVDGAHWLCQLVDPAFPAALKDELPDNEFDLRHGWTQYLPIATDDLDKRGDLTNADRKRLADAKYRAAQGRV